MKHEKQTALFDPTRFMYSSRMTPAAIFISDVLCLLISGISSTYLFESGQSASFDNHGNALVVLVFIVLLLFRTGGLYEIDAIMRPVKCSDSILVAVPTAVFFFLAVASALGATEKIYYSWCTGFGVIGVCTVLIGRLLLCRLFRRLSRRRVIGRSMAVFGECEQIRHFMQQMGNVNPFFTSIQGIYYDTNEGYLPEIEGYPVVVGLDALMENVRRHKIEDVVIATSGEPSPTLLRTVDRLKELPVNVYISTDLFGYQLELRPVLGRFHELPLFEVVERPISGLSSVLKAVEDYVLAMAILLLLLPLFALVAIAIKLDSPGPVFFMQRRLGFNNQEFKIIKFRSMRHEPESDANVAQAKLHDSRITRFGQIIRSTSIDELPQLLNVLNGTMSLVGPRPHALSHNQEYGRQIRGYFARHKVKPGITGWAQVNGLRGETKALEAMKARVGHDIHYAENWSLLFDLRILAMTLIVVLFQKNAH